MKAKMMPRRSSSTFSIETGRTKTSSPTPSRSGARAWAQRNAPRMGASSSIVCAALGGENRVFVAMFQKRTSCVTAIGVTTSQYVLPTRMRRL